MRIFNAVLLFGLSVAVAGCSTEPGGIFRTFDVDKERTSITTGARQRAIIVRRPNLYSRPGLISPSSVVCAEPSPDVAIAIATSFGAGVSIFGQGSGSVSGQAAEGLLQLAERTAAIQLMRDQMFRACEAYANGALTGTNYSLLMSQITQTMVTLLLGETAGGRFGRSLGALGGKSSAEAKATLAGMPGAFKDINESKSKLADAQLKLQAAEAELATAKEKHKADPTNQEVTDATTKRNRLKAERDAVNSLLQSQIDTSAKAAGEISTATAGGSIAAKPDTATAGVLAEMQRTFVQRDPSHSLVEACLVEMGMWNVDEGVKHFARGIVPKDGKQNNDFSILEAFAASKMERTGLFAFCQAYLPQYATEIYRTNASLSLERLKIHRSAQELNWIDTRAKAAAGYASALAQCDKIGDGPSKESCKEAVLELRGKSLPSLTLAAADRQESLQRSAPNLVSLTGFLAKAVQAYDRVTQELGTLSISTPATTLPADKKAALDARRVALAKRQSDLTTDVATLDATLSATNRGTTGTNLRNLETQQLDASAELAKEKPQDQRALDLARLEVVRREAAIEQKKIETTIEKLGQASAKLATLKTDVEAFNAEAK